MSPFREAASGRAQLGMKLRQLRLRADLTQEELAEQLETSQSQVSRIERGEQTASTSVVEQWADVCDAPSDQLDQLVEHAEQVALRTVAWRSALRKSSLDQLQRSAGEVEQTAGTIRNFSALLVPGLLQVPGYARQVFEAGHPGGREDIPAAVAARMNRQALLYSESTQFEFVITETALRWGMGPVNVMLAQIDRIETVSTLDHVTVAILPMNLHEAWREHWFNIFDDRDEHSGTTVHVETLTRGIRIDDPDEVARYQDMFTRLREAAATGDEARDLLRRIREDLIG